MLIAFVLALSGALFLYLASAHQTWLKRSLPVTLARVCSVLLLAGSLIAMWLAMNSLAAFFMFVSLLMLVLVALPYLGAARQVWRLRKPHE